jgi:hypothetical protein
MVYMLNAPVKVTIYDPELKKDRVGIIFPDGKSDGWGILCDDGTFIFLDEHEVKAKDLFCSELRQSFLLKGYLCVSRNVKRPIYEECKIVGKLNR